PHIYNQDFLIFDISSLENSSNQKIKFIGNLPYNISSPILFKVINDSDKIVDAHFMLQKEFVERIVSLPNSKSYGRLSVI
ncbi:16S rRNA (adenine(1518)-N(6)/adenine(1519)-N(6))-dimethyltransferase, partial [Francisella tularensis subsp. holarctica]|uniref:rRNA adenine N-6-methyltransferase family protein n=1 Tax=Francisella tularensis TaxID=263 RepID=UPI0023819A7E